MAESKTKYYSFTGRAFWAKLYEPDEFRGAVRWSVNLYLDDETEWAKFKESGIQKTVKEGPDGKYFQLYRPTTKAMGARMVRFTPPIVYDKNGEALVKYVDSNNQIIRSYEDPNFKFVRVGEPVLIGNGSKIKVNVSVYPTQMGPGNRLESIQIVDLIEYKRPEEPVAPTKKDDEIPW